MNAKEFLKSDHPFLKVTMGIIIVYSIIMIFNAGYVTGQYIHTLVN